ncbi:hypothetical protein KAR91_35920 [Candidatus Pacearchaeota archaeon]|nr:hypothetical protein [Candidatus Pacearchaeota archaeon]
MISNAKNIRVFFESIDYHVVQTRQEIEQAYSLVYQEYLNRGYVKENMAKLRTSIFNVLPGVTTFVAMFEDKVIATATIIPDTPLGLPMDDLYYEELNVLRNDHKKISEISMLANSTLMIGEGISLMLNAKKMFIVFYLFKHMFDYVKDYLGLDFICITINPKHNLTYESLYFKDFGGLKEYDKVNGAPALGKCLDIHSVEDACQNDSRRKNFYSMFFGGHISPEKFENKFIFSQEDLKDLFVEKTQILQNLSTDELECVKKCYPNYDFSKIIP